MIICQKCKASISLQMKHSIKSNQCPYCGSHLIDNDSLKICKSISNSLLSAGFNDKIFELSLFIFKNYYKNREESEIDKSSNLEELSESSFSENESEVFESQEFHEENYVSKEDEDLDEDLDEDDRVSRLKKLAKNNPILNKKGTVVRRIMP